METLFASVHESAPGPSRHFAAAQFALPRMSGHQADMPGRRLRAPKLTLAGVSLTFAWDRFRQLALNWFISKIAHSDAMPESKSPIVDQIFEAVCGHVQRCSIYGSLITRSGPGALVLQDVVNFVFDHPEFGLAVRFPYPTNQRV